MNNYFYSKFNFSEEYRKEMIEMVRRMSNVEIGGHRFYDGTGTHYMQNPEEITDFIRSVKDKELKRGEKFTSFLEIGFSAGINNTFINKFFNFSNLVAIDIMQPTSMDPRTFLANLRFKNLTLLVGDSSSKEVIEKGKKLGGYDLIFIDGGHTYENVKNDFVNYAPMLNKGGVIGLHDVRAANFPGVGNFWQELQKEQGHLWHFEEFWTQNNHTEYGIGLVSKKDP